MVPISLVFSFRFRHLDHELDYFGHQKALKTYYILKYERVTAPESKSSCRDMQNRLILVSNRRNFHMFTALQRSASGAVPD